MTDDELSVRLEWPERNNEPFRPASDDAARSSQSPPGRELAGDDVAQLRRAVAELRTEVAALRAEVARLAGTSARPVADEGGRRREDRRPISVRMRSSHTP